MSRWRATPIVSIASARSCALLTESSSWEEAFFALFNHKYHEKDFLQYGARKFFEDPAVTKLLSEPTTAFPPASAPTKDAFDARTRPINATPANAPYNVKEVKEDALWLSQKAGIDEVSALRVVVLEFQTRSHAQLLGEFSEEETISLQDVLNTHSSSVLNSGLLLAGANADSLQKKFDTEASRRIRLLYIYLSERKYFWKTLTFLVEIRYFRILNTAPEGASIPWYCTANLVAVGQRSNEPEQPDQRVKGLISSLRSASSKLFEGKGCGWCKEQEEEVEVELAWASNQLSEAIHIMELIYQNIYVLDENYPSAMVLDWFRFVNEFQFFNEVQMVRILIALPGACSNREVAVQPIEPSTRIRLPNSHYPYINGDAGHSSL